LIFPTANIRAHPTAMSTRQNNTPQDTALVASPSGIVTQNGFVGCGKAEVIRHMEYAHEQQTAGNALFRRGVAREKA
jgi:hypothetical protein